jgi:hypothetical protein
MSEAKEQEALIERAQYHPITRDLLYAIPNDGIRTPAQGAKFKRRGLRPGMPDICLPYSSSGFHALYIELKTKIGKPTATQLQCIANLRKAGNAAYVAYGWEHAWEIITHYLRQNDMTPTYKIESSMQITSVNYSSNQWYITMQGNDWPWMMKLTDKIKCPDCKTYKVTKNGKTSSKNKQQYRCLNANCVRYSFTPD